MKQICNFITILILSLVFTIVANAVAAKTLYDDFSGNYINPQKWNQHELVIKVANGKLLSKVGNSADVDDVRNITVFQNPASIDIIECDVIVFQAVLDTGTNSQSVARVDGRFYNTLNDGTEKGDIWAGVFIGDQGNGIEAWWEVWEAIDDNGDSWEEKKIETLVVPGLAYGQPYKVKIDYDGNNNFTFSVHGVSGSFTGLARQAAANAPYKGLETVVYTDNGAGNGFVSASFDNVYINSQASAYDEFSTTHLDQTKWQNLEFVREIENGKVRLMSHSTGERENALIGFSEISPYVEATVKIKNNSMIDPGDRGIARISGYFYNDTYGPGDHNEYEGNVWAAININYYGDGTLNAECTGLRTLDAADTQWDNLFYRKFNLPIILDRTYKLSMRFTGSKLFFTCKDTVTGRIDFYAYEISTPIYESYNQSMSLRSRVYGDSTGGKMVVEFDDVYVDVAEPGATYDANGDWELTVSNLWANSGCDLPDASDDDITITQNGNDITFVVHDDYGTTLEGNVYGDTYTFKMTEESNGETEIKYGVFTLSDSTSGAGNVTFVWFDDTDSCESGFSISMTKSPTDDGGGGGGGGGCFIPTLIQ